MNGIMRSCSTCKYAYYRKDTSRHPMIGILRQHCASEDYNSLTYTEEMYLADIKKGCCRFWTPDEEENN